MIAKKSAALIGFRLVCVWVWILDRRKESMEQFLHGFLGVLITDGQYECVLLER